MSAIESFPHRYTAELANKIEASWQDRWEREETFNAPNPVGELAGDGELAPKPTSCLICSHIHQARAFTLGTHRFHCNRLFGTLPAHAR